MSQFGLRDSPIESFAEEALGLTEYADALAQFVCQCETPMTVALQGDWGSGKTSLMCLMQEKIRDTNPSIRSVWFNTWEYSQFDLDSQLVVSLFYHFADIVGGNTVGQAIRGIFQKLWSVVGKTARIGTIAAAATVGQAEAAKEGLGMLPTSTGMDPSGLIRELKAKLTSTVDQLLKSKSTDRIIIFIDDLDRLIPQRAVELLECLKLFLDMKGCVFVLACDYAVVTQGLKQKFGMSEADLRGRSFFDKIIQVPFAMPLTHYRVERYFEALLKRIEVPFEATDLHTYIELAQSSVGFNPRSMKRLFNSLLLLRLVAERKQVFSGDDACATLAEKMRILFATLCMQSVYPALFRFLLVEQVDQHGLQRLSDESLFSTAQQFSELRRELQLDANEAAVQRFCRFAAAFFRAVQLKSDQDSSTLSVAESQNLKRILSFSAVVSTEKPMQFGEVKTLRRNNRKFAEQLRAQILMQFMKELKKLGIYDRDPEISQIGIEQEEGRLSPWVRIELPLCHRRLGAGGQKDPFILLRLNLHFLFGNDRIACGMSGTSNRQTGDTPFEISMSKFDRWREWFGKLFPDARSHESWYEHYEQRTAERAAIESGAAGDMENEDGQYDDLSVDPAIAAEVRKLYAKYGLDFDEWSRLFGSDEPVCTLWDERCTPNTSEEEWAAKFKRQVQDTLERALPTAVKISD